MINHDHDDHDHNLNHGQETLRPSETRPGRKGDEKRGGDHPLQCIGTKLNYLQCI